MNKEKAIKEIKKASERFYACDYIKTKVAESIISKIHEPQKVVVPKFVGEWYERNKDGLDSAIYSTITETYRKVNGENNDLLDTFETWLVFEDNSILTLVRMYLLGYDIEVEEILWHK